jgi:hypothetical protein
VLQARLVADLLREGAVPEPFAIIMTGEGAHPPYGAPEPYHSMYTGAQVAAAASGDASSAPAERPTKRRRFMVLSRTLQALITGL